MPGSPSSSSGSAEPRRPSPPGKSVAATSAKLRCTASNVSRTDARPSPSARAQLSSSVEARLEIVRCSASSSRRSFSPRTPLSRADYLPSDSRRRSRRSGRSASSAWSSPSAARRSRRPRAGGAPRRLRPRPARLDVERRHARTPRTPRRSATSAAPAAAARRRDDRCALRRRQRVPEAAFRTALRRRPLLRAGPSRRSAPASTRAS